MSFSSVRSYLVNFLGGSATRLLFDLFVLTMLSIVFSFVVRLLKGHVQFNSLLKKAKK